MKQCTRCGEVKEFEAFKRKTLRYKGRVYHKGWSSRCRVCLHQIDKEREKQRRKERHACMYCKAVTSNVRVCDGCKPFRGSASRRVFSKWLAHIAQTQDRELLEQFKRFLGNMQMRYGRNSAYKTAAIVILTLFEAQKFKCAICRSVLTNPCVDHNHETFKVRAILCKTCNTAVGMVKESYSIAVSLAQYIKKHELE